MKSYAFCVLLCFAVCAVTALPTLNMSGFAWAENLVFDAHGNLYVSDTMTGILWRIHLSADQQSYVRDEFISSGHFHRINGLTVTEDGNTIYAVVELASNKEPWLVSFSINHPNQYQPLVMTPVLGNGLALHFATGLFFTANEGNFVPGKGVVYEINVKQNHTSEAVKYLSGADGVQIDQANNWVYVSEVLSGTMLRYSLANGTLSLNSKFVAPGVGSVDDFCLIANGTQIAAADYTNGQVVQFNSDGSSTSNTLVISNLISPTACKVGSGPQFNNEDLFITEGGGKFPYVHNRRVLEAPFVV